MVSIVPESSDGKTEVGLVPSSRDGMFLERTTRWYIEPPPERWLYVLVILGCPFLPQCKLNLAVEIELRFSSSKVGRVPLLPPY